MLSPKELARRWSVSHRQVLDWISQGRIKALRMGHRTTRIPVQEVERCELLMGQGRFA